LRLGRSLASRQFARIPDACFAARNRKKQFSSRETIPAGAETFLAFTRKQAAQAKA
jgi:hypothetical protein